MRADNFFLDTSTIIQYCYLQFNEPHIKRMNTKNKKTLEALFERPVRSDIKWQNVKVLLYSLGACVKEGNGSRVGIKLCNVCITIHKPHPHKELKKVYVLKIRRFLIKVEIYHEV